MSEGKVEIRWVDGEFFVGQDRYGNTLTIGSTPGVEPEWRGLKPSDLLLLGLIGCSGYDVVTILQKQRQKIAGFAVTAAGEQLDQEPYRFTKIHVEYRFRGAGLNQEFIKRAIELSEQKYCSVYNTLRDSVQLTSSYTIEP
jgi:putative redox protein